MSYNTGFYKGRLGIGLTSSMGMGDGNPRYPLDINGDIRLTGSILNANGQVLSLVPVEQGNWSIGNNNLSYTGGNVGIGTTSPHQLLTVRASSGTNYDGICLETNTDHRRINMASSGSGGSGNAYLQMWGSDNNSSSEATAKIQIHTGADSYFNGGNVGIGTTSPDRGLCILDNQNTGTDMGLYPLGYNSDYQEPASLKIFQHLPLPSTSRISDGGGNLNPAINIVANYVNSSANSTTHLGGSIQFTTQSRLGAGAGAGHGQAYAAIYGGRHSAYSNYEGEMIFYTSDTTNRASGVNLNPRMTIKGGNVGIGTTDPGSKLEIYDNSPAGQVKDILHVKNYDGYDMVSLGTSSNFNSGQVTLYKNTTTKASANESVVINANGNSYFNGGNVGIGQTSPQAKLHIKGSAEMLRLESTSGTGSTWISFRNGGSQRWYIGMGSSSTNNMYIYTYNSSHLALVHGGGSVGIGSDSQYQDAKLGINVGDEGTMLSSPDISQFLWRINHSAKWGIYWSTNGSGNNYYFNSDSNPNQILFIGNNAARACIDLDNGAIRTKDWYYIENSGDGIYCNHT